MLNKHGRRTKAKFRAIVYIEGARRAAYAALKVRWPVLLERWQPLVRLVATINDGALLREPKPRSSKRHRT